MLLTVLNHLEAAGYDPAFAKSLNGTGEMECEMVEIKTFRCRPWQYGPEAIAVEATAVVPFTDGCMRPYPDGWGGKGHRISAYFAIADDGIAPVCELKWPTRFGEEGRRC